jgi:hypothetical protein
MNKKKLLLLPALFYAQICVAAGDWYLENPAPGAGVTLEDFVYLLINILMLVAVPALALCIIYGGYLLVSAGGNETQVTKAKQWILWSMVGGAIILGANVIADIVFGTAAPFL